MKDSPPTPYSAVILAADRRANDPLIRHTGVSSKSLIQIAGTPMVLRVLKALGDSKEIGPRLLAGPSWKSVEQVERLRTLIQMEEVGWIANQQTPSASAYAAMQTIDRQTPVLLTTADHPLLNAKIVDYFCGHARASGLDLAVGMTTLEQIRQEFPSIKKTVLRFNDGNYCGCNLFAFLTPQSRSVADYWRRIENQRKNPLRVISTLGWIAVLRYLFGQLSLDEGLLGLSERLGLRIGAVQLPFAEAAIDVDTVDDHSLVQQLARDQEQRHPP